MLQRERHQGLPEELPACRQGDRPGLPSFTGTPSPGPPCLLLSGLNEDSPAPPEAGLQSWRWGLSTGGVLRARCPLEEHCSGHQARVLDSTLPPISGMTQSPCAPVHSSTKWEYI